MSKIIYTEEEDINFRRAMKTTLKGALLMPEYIGQKTNRVDSKGSPLHVGDIILYPASVERPHTYIISSDGEQVYVTRMLPNGMLLSLPLDWFDDFILDAKHNA